MNQLAERVVAQVLADRSDPPKEPPAYIDQEMQPLITLLTEVGDQLRRRGATASLEFAEGANIRKGFIRDVRASLRDNDGALHSFGFRALIVRDMTVGLYFTGLDEPASQRLDPFFDEGHLKTLKLQLPEVMTALADFLIRQLSSKAGR